MKPWQYITTLMLALTCLGVSVSIVIVSSARQRVLEESNVRQLQLNSGVLGQQGQQVQMAILQDMANSAAQNPKMRRLLIRHGYTLQGGATNAPSTAKEE
jgi:hypothetical protein